MNKNVLADKLEFANFFNQVKIKLPWLLLFLFLGISTGYLVSKYKKQVYSAKATIKIDDKSANMTDFLAIDMFSESFNQESGVLTEARIISSRTMIEKALNKLPLDVRYFKKGSFSSYELYRKSPINLNILSSNDEVTPIEIEIEFIDEDHFEVSYEKNGVRETSINLTFNKSFKIFNETYSIERVFGVSNKSIETDGSYVIRVVDKIRLAQEFAKDLVVSQIEEKVSIISIEYKSSNPLLCKEFVDALVSSYSNMEFELKAQAASNTIKFIDERLDQISASMNDVEDQITQFKQEKKVINFETIERIESERLIDLESQKRISELRILNFNIVENELNQGKKLSEVSINAEGNMDPTLNQLITSFNNLKIQKATLGVNFTTDSKKAREIDSQIIETINSIRESISLSKLAVGKEIEYLNSKIDILNNRYNIFPEDQQDYFHLIRDFEVNQKVVSFLMEKKIEASIANASIIPDTQVIDLPILPEKPISIGVLYIYLICIFLSITIGIAVILLIVFLNDKIYDKSILETSTTIPVLGTITVSKSKEFESLAEILGLGRTIFKESINSLRTNLRFLPSTKSAQVISVTSTVSQEGKSFTLINLATSLTLLGKSVVVVDLDMRKPKIQHYFKMDNNLTGASMFLSGKSNMEEVIFKSEIPNLDVVLSGPIPPNPMELVQSDRFNEMLSYLKKHYEYVMIDNPPIGIVADSINVMKNSDINIFVVRAGFSRIGFLDTAINVKAKNEIPNLYFVLNGVDKTSSGYYRNYSQGYYAD